jgi:hypothetical protein
LTGPQRGAGIVVVMDALLAARGRPTGRGRPRGPFLHLVPGTDRTRSALCGARVGGQTLPWPVSAGADDTPCPECAALVARGAA